MKSFIFIWLFLLTIGIVIMGFVLFDTAKIAVITADNVHGLAKIANGHQKLLERLTTTKK